MSSVPAFLPPDGATAPLVATPPIPADAFAPLRMRSLLATRWLWFAAAIGVAALGIDAMWLREQSNPDWNVDELVAVSKLMDTTAIVQLVTYTIGAVIFIAWFHRAYGNLRALGVPKPRHDRGWAIGSWFVPLVNLVMPKQLTNDVWRAGDPELRPGDPDWQARPVAAVVHWWWALWLVGGTVYRIAATLMTDADSIEKFRVAVMFDAVSQAIGIASAVVAIVVVKRVTSRQEARARLVLV